MTMHKATCLKLWFFTQPSLSLVARLTWCFCRRLRSCSIFCCFSSFSVLRASRRFCLLERLYALELRAVSRVVSRRMQPTTSCRSWRWKLRRRRARISMRALVWRSSGNTAGIFFSSTMRAEIREAILGQVNVCINIIHLKENNINSHDTLNWIPGCIQLIIFR